jgi:hypothetical protein
VRHLRDIISVKVRALRAQRPTFPETVIKTEPEDKIALLRRCCALKRHRVFDGSALGRSADVINECQVVKKISSHLEVILSRIRLAQMISMIARTYGIQILSVEIEAREIGRGGPKKHIPDGPTAQSKEDLDAKITWTESNDKGERSVSQAMSRRLRLAERRMTIQTWERRFGTNGRIGI